MTPVEWAHRFADAGIKVHPVYWVDRDVDEYGQPEDSCACHEDDCRSIAKHPIVSTDDSSTDSAQIDAWWEQYPSANLGVNTEGLTIVDVDFRTGGMESYRLLQPDLPATFRVRTGNGFHEYYQGEVPKQGGKLATGIDFKSGPNQQVVGPGSEHMSGVDYEIMTDGAMAPVPSRVQELAGKRSKDASSVLPEAPIRGEMIHAGEGNDALVAAAAFFANHSRTYEELVGHLYAVAIASMDDPASEDRIREIAKHRWDNHDKSFVDPALGALLKHLDDDGNYVFDAIDVLESIIDGTYRAPQATILERPEHTDEKCVLCEQKLTKVRKPCPKREGEKPCSARGLFYGSSLNLVFGEDSIGKTWVSLSAAQYVLARGGKVVHLDWDDSYATCAFRLHLLGAKEEELRERYFHKTSPGDIRPTGGPIQAVGADLIIIDVVANAIAAADLNEDKASDYLKWAAETAIPWARAGACVILNDHVTKGQGDHAYARGSGAKRGGVDGAAYEVKAVEMLLPGEGGTLSLRLQKDRHGSIGRRGEEVAHLQYASDMTLDIVDPPVDEEEAVDHLAGLRMALYRERLEAGWTYRDAVRLTSLPPTTVQRLVDQMLATNHAIVAEPGDGSRHHPRTFNLLPPPTAAP